MLTCCYYNGKCDRPAVVVVREAPVGNEIINDSAGASCAVHRPAMEYFMSKGHKRPIQIDWVSSESRVSV